jgi:hypothetical protein
MREAEKIVREKYCQNDESIDLSEMNIPLSSVVHLMEEYKSLKVNEVFSAFGDFLESLKTKKP